MDSINRLRVHERISHVFDTCVGAQGDKKGIKSYIKDLRKAVGLEDLGGNSTADANDFLHTFRSVI